MEKTADEIVRALRCEGEYQDNDYAWSEDLHRDAADLITRLNEFDQTQTKIVMERCQKIEAQLATERDKYAELQRYNVDCTKQCDALLVENQQLRAAWGLLGAVGHEMEGNNGKDV